MRDQDFTGIYHSDIFKIVLIYAVFAGGWVLLSDRVVFWLSDDHAFHMIAQTLKGWVFVAVTAVLLYFLLSKLIPALKKQEEAYRSLFDNIMNSVVHARIIFAAGKPVDMEYISSNPAFSEITGITEPVVGRRISEVIPGYCENNPESLETFGRVATTGEPTRWEHYLRELDRWFSFMIYSPAQGEVVIVSENITERKKTELALQISEKRFADIVAASADWIWEVDASGRYTYVADSVSAVLGYTAQDMLGKTPFDFMPTDEAARVEAEFAAIVAQRQPFLDLDNINLHKDGGIRHISTNGVPMFGEQGELLGYRGVDKDITEKKKNELMLIENEARWRQLFNQSPIPLGIVNHDGVIVDINRHFVSTFGYTLQDVPTLADWWRRAYPDPIYRSQVMSTWDHATQQAATQHSDIEPVLYKVTCKNGKVRDVVISGTRIGNEFLATFIDITEREAAEAELRKRNDELERFNRASVGRELDMIELKKQVNALSAELKRERPYKLEFITDDSGK